jgi:hypothetical protein
VKLRLLKEHSELKNLPEFKTPTAQDVAYAKTTLQDRGLNISDAAVREVAAIQKAYPQLTREQVVSMLIQQGNLSVEKPGFFRLIREQTLKFSCG